MLTAAKLCLFPSLNTVSLQHKFQNSRAGAGIVLFSRIRLSPAGRWQSLRLELRLRVGKGATVCKTFARATPAWVLIILTGRNLSNSSLQCVRTQRSTSKRSECFVYISGWSGGGPRRIVGIFLAEETRSQCGMRHVRLEDALQLYCIFTNTLKFERDWLWQQLRGMRSDSCPLDALLSAILLRAVESL